MMKTMKYSSGEGAREAQAEAAVQQQPRAGYKRLVVACKHKDLDTIKRILSERPELANQKDRHNRTLLHFAAILLLQDEPPTEHLPAAESKVQSLERNIDCFDYLTDRCDLHLWWEQDSDGLSILHMAVISSNLPLVEHIVYGHPYSVKYPLVCTLDNERHTPLHWAVITNNLDCVKLLINFAGTKLAHEPDLNGATPLHYATQTSDYPKYRQQLGRMLREVGGDSAGAKLTNGSSFEQEPGGKQPAGNGRSLGPSEDKQQALEQQRSLDILRYLVRLPQINLECADKDRRTPLLWAASSGNRDALALLLSHGARATSCDANKLSAMHCAASHGYTDCLECLLSMKPQAVDVNQADNLSCTPLFYSVLSSNVDCVETLLDRGAQADWQDSKGRTAAHFAALRGQLASLKLLESRGANLWLANKQGDLPLHYAVKSGRIQVIRWLLEHSPYERAVNAINNYGRAPIHLAVLKGNTQLVDFLIRQGANLNQLVKSRQSSKSQESSKGRQSGEAPAYQYETALDMAKSHNQGECLRLLGAQRAMTAAQVLSERRLVALNPRDSKGNTKSLFEVQATDGVSPIGFETSCSSATPSSTCKLAMQRSISLSGAESKVPKLAGPQPLDGLLRTDSSNSSQGTPSNNINNNQPSADPWWQQSSGEAHHAPKSWNRAASPTYKGGISYNNQHICASIKCKLYGAADASEQNRQALVAKPSSAGHQEIVTNVNVYTSPSPRQSCRHHSQRRMRLTGEVDPASETDESEFSTEGEQFYADPADDAKLPPLDGAEHLTGAQERSQPGRASLGQLPVILSEQEFEQTDSQHTSGANSPLDGNKAELRRASPAWEEPRFDRSPVARPNARQQGGGGGKQPARVSRQIKSPVAEYIRSGIPQQPAAKRPGGKPTGRNQTEKENPSGRSSSMSNSSSHPQQRLDLDAVRAKVDSNLEPDHHLRARSTSRLSSNAGSSTSPSERHQPRSVSRQTIIRTRRLSVDSVELATRVERSIRKYKQESKLFEELQRLKRSQIRSGRANEALLVKRLVEHLQGELRDLIGLDSYSGPYTYMAYERFLYDQLRKLSLSNCAKLSRHHHRQRPPKTEPKTDQSAATGPDYADEDSSADLELRKLMQEHELAHKDSNAEQESTDGTVEDSCSVELEPSGALGEIRVKVEQAPERGADTILKQDSREQSGPVKKSERRPSLAARESTESATGANNPSPPKMSVDRADSSPSEVRGEVEETASSLSSVIMTDALGNISRAGSANLLRKTKSVELPDKDLCPYASSKDDGESKTGEANTGEDECQAEAREKEQREGGEGAGEVRPQGRRRSVINIGNRMELVVHDVGIEIEPAPDEEQEAASEDTAAEPDPSEETQQPEMLNVDLSAEDLREPDSAPASLVGSDNESAGEESGDAAGGEGGEAADPGQGDADGVSQSDQSGEKGARTVPDSLKNPTGRQKVDRRESSPPAYHRPRLESQTSRDRPTLKSMSRSLSVDKQQQQVEKKVFDGRDLDERRSSKSSSGSAKAKRGPSGDSSEGQEEIGAQSSDQQAANATRTRLARRPGRRLPPSRIPSRKFQINVPTEEIKQRWSAIRAEQRAAGRQATGMRGARSQPANLDSSGFAGADNGREDDDVDGDGGARFSNGASGDYVVIYEINQNNRGLIDGHETTAEGNQKVNFHNGASTAKQQVHRDSYSAIQGKRDQRGAGGAEWCQRRAVNIVDLRSIKRTLSLPDTLIYSNNLLKKFNILKL